MAERIKLEVGGLQALRQMNPMLMSYNVEFAEVTGGTFWKAYTPGQIAGTEEFYVEPTTEGIAAMYRDLRYMRRSICMTKNCANWQRNWDRYGCVCPAPGQQKHIMILTEPPTEKFRKDT